MQRWLHRVLQVIFGVRPTHYPQRVDRQLQHPQL